MADIVYKKSCGTDQGGQKIDSYKLKPISYGQKMVEAALKSIATNKVAYPNTKSDKSSSMCNISTSETWIDISRQRDRTELRDKVVLSSTDGCAEMVEPSHVSTLLWMLPNSECSLHVSDEDEGPPELVLPYDYNRHLSLDGGVLPSGVVQDAILVPKSPSLFSDLEDAEVMPPRDVEDTEVVPESPDHKDMEGSADYEDDEFGAAVNSGSADESGVVMDSDLECTNPFEESSNESVSQSSGTSYRPDDDEESNDDENETDDDCSTVYPVMDNYREKEVVDEKTNYSHEEGDNVLKAKLEIMGHEQVKKHFCLYCSKAFSKIARHLEVKHSQETEVAKTLSYSKSSKERMSAWASLRKKGDFEHNFQCREKKSGCLVPKYRSRNGQGKTSEDYVTCFKCLGLYLKQRLWYHQQSCKGENGKAEKGHGRGIVAGKMLDPVSLDDKAFRDKVLVEMRDDSVKRVVQNDQLILEYGKRLFEKHKEPRYIPYVANKIRELGRLAEDGKQRHNWKNLEDGLDPSKFEQLLQAVKSVAGFDSETNAYSSPSTALKLGYSMSTCSLILKVRALRDSDDILLKNCKNFSDLYAAEWFNRIALHAHRTLDLKKYNKPRRLPFVEDVVKLNTYLKIQATKTRHALTERDGQKEAYIELAQVCLAQVILFNRRRSGEAQWVKTAEVEEALKNCEVGGDAKSDLLTALTPFEKNLFQTHVRIETKGKRGRRVPILLTADMKQSLCELLRHKSAAGVESEFIFGKPGSVKPFRGHVCLKQLSIAAELKHPELMTSTRLRQQLGTHCQVLGLSENSQDILATFMGHDIRVHRNFYRLPENLLQIAKVSKVLHAINSGKLSDVKGKDFDSISFDLNEELETEDALDDTNPKSDNGDACSEEDEAMSHDDCQVENTAAVHNERKRQSGTMSAAFDKRLTMNQKKRKRLTDVISDADDSRALSKLLDSDSGMIASPSSCFKKKRKPFQKKKWTLDEIAAVNRCLGSYIRRQTLPGKQACEDAIKKESSLHSRSWTAVKFYIKNRIAYMVRTSSQAH